LTVVSNYKDQGSFLAFIRNLFWSYPQLDKDFFDTEVLKAIRIALLTKIHQFELKSFCLTRFDTLSPSNWHEIFP